MRNARDCDYDKYPMCEIQKWFFYLQDDKDIKQPYKYKCYQNTKAQILTQLLTQILTQMLFRKYSFISDTYFVYFPLKYENVGIHQRCTRQDIII